MSKFKKIAVVNFSGNVGKSTLAKHLLAPHMGDCPVVSVETINADAASDDLVKGGQFGQLQEDMLMQERVIVDVGSSNIEEFLRLMKRYEGSHEDFDLYVVPCVPVPKQQKDTMSCILELAKLGIPSDKIRIVFNQVPEGEKPEVIFAALLQFVKDEAKALANPDWAVYTSELFSKIGKQSKTLKELADDPTDFKAMIAASQSADAKMDLAARLSIKRLSQGVQRNMQAVYHSLTAS